jgi:hypothetical protein
MAESDIIYALITLKQWYFSKNNTSLADMADIYGGRMADMVERCLIKNTPYYAFRQIIRRFGGDRRRQ